MNKGTSVRLSDELTKRLNNIAQTTGFRPSDLIRRAVQKYCDEIEKAGAITISLEPKKTL